MKSWCEDDKSAAISLIKEAGYSPTEVKRWARSKGYQTDLKSCKNLCGRVRDGQEISRKTGSGRGKSIEEEEQASIDLIHGDSSLSVREVADSVGISKSSVARAFHESRYNNYTKYDQVELDDRKKEKRLQCSEKLLNEFEEGTRDLSKMVFSDETLMPMRKPRGKETFWAQAEKKAEVDPELLGTSHSNRRDGLLVWGCVNGKEKVDLMTMPSITRMDSSFYTDKVLAKHALPRLEKVYPDHDFSLQQDWAPCHGSNATKEFLKKKNVDFLSKDEWPSNSPDLNPMDYRVWGDLKNRVYKKGEPSTIGELERNVKEAWDEMPQSSFKKSIGELKERLGLVKKNKGGAIEGEFKARHGK